MNRPETSEYNEYYEKYVSTVGDEDVVNVLKRQPAELNLLFANLSEDRGNYAYEVGKWTLKEALSHLIDGERIFAYRVLRISRGDETPIEGFEQDGYIENSNANNRTFAELLDEFDLQRRSNLLLINNLSDDGSRRLGTASGMGISARGLIYIMAGHVRHHLEIFKERYSI
ncbi:MAG: DinB family protein [Pyrinomonadaceae bacterium]